jgi:hypothetical protein
MPLAPNVALLPASRRIPRFFVSLGDNTIWKEKQDVAAKRLAAVVAKQTFSLDLNRY